MFFSSLSLVMLELLNQHHRWGGEEYAQESDVSTSFTSDLYTYWIIGAIATQRKKKIILPLSQIMKANKNFIWSHFSVILGSIVIISWHMFFPSCLPLGILHWLVLGSSGLRRDSKLSINNPNSKKLFCSLFWVFRYSIPILKMEKLGHRGVRQLSQGQGECQSQFQTQACVIIILVPYYSALSKPFNLYRIHIFLWLT